ncbi:hypothetical protein ACWET9_38220 [Streptomyces sp. NPDC004059]
MSDERIDGRAELRRRSRPKFRALLANGDFDRYWTYHLGQEHQRNHQACYQLAA